MRLIVKSKPRPKLFDPAGSVVVGRTSLRVRHRPIRILDFDCEARPLHWYGGDFVSKEITAIAWAWADRPDQVTCYLLGEADPVEMLEAFRAAYDRADMVTGHYIRGFDLPLINGALTEYLRPALSDKLSCDTKLDLVRRHGISGSQENIGAMLHLDHPKVSMDQAKWRSANRLTAKGRAEVRKRVIGDVQQHCEMRLRLLELGYLGPAKVWRSGSAQVESYTP